MEDVEDKIQDVINKDVQRRKTIKYHILRRQMTPRGPLERKLTWDAMEEIRYLKQEQPEEWTVERLAEGFSVSEDVILRVLRSKFVPNPERKAKQDAKVMRKLEQQVLPLRRQVEQEKQRLTSGPTQAALLSGSKNSALIPMGNQSLIPQTEEKIAALNVVNKHKLSQVTKYSIENTQEIQESTESAVVDKEEDDDAEEDEHWDGQVLSEEDIEELITVKCTPVIKEGDEFFDVHGNFLYRI